MRDSRDDGPFEKHAFAVAAGLVGAFVALWMLDFAVVRADWCEGAPVQCFREWLSATSGWVAAIVAIGVAVVTITPLRHQVAEARRQTDFLVGDAKPDFVLTRTRGSREVRLRVTNWNRRSIAIDKVDLYIEIMGKFPLAVDSYQSEGRSGIRKEFPVFIVRGWTNRNTGPTRRYVIFGFSEDRSELDLHESLRGPLRAKINFRVIGQRHERQYDEALAIELN